MKRTDLLTLRRNILVLLFVCVSFFSFLGSASAYVIGPTTPGKWGTPGFGTPGGTVTWSLMGTGVDLTSEPDGVSTALSSFMPVGFKAEIESAFGAWSSVADITFLEVPDLGEPFDVPGASGHIRIGGHSFDGAGSVLAHGFFPPVNGVTAAGDIHFDIAETWVLTDPEAGFTIFRVAAHEIGHAIGLDHEPPSITALMNPFYTETTPLGLLADDIAGAQSIYGPAVTAVPEPRAIMLLGIGVLGMLGYGWRRRKQPNRTLLNI